MMITSLTAEAAQAAESGKWDNPELSTLLGSLMDSQGWEEHGACLVDNVPIQDAATTVEACSRALGNLLPQDGAGQIVREVRYRGIGLGEGATGRYSDSRVGGNLHTDGPHRQSDPPLIFTLLCVRQSADGGALVLIDIERVVQELDADSFEVLQSDFLFDQREDNSRPFARPVLLQSDSGRWQLFYLREYIELGHRHTGSEALTGAQMSALNALDRVIDRMVEEPTGHSEIKLEPGQMIIVDNRRMLHGRTAFGDSEEDRDRLMLRTWIGPPAEVR